MVLDGPVRPGSRGGHGPIRYTVEAYEPDRRVHFRFSGPAGFDGTHGFSVRRAGAAHVALEHRLEMRVHGRSRLSWGLVWRPLHDALIEDCLDRAQALFGDAPAPTRRSARVRLLRRLARGPVVSR